MALIKCHECGNEVSTEAKTCPTCGAKVKVPSSLGKLFGIAGLVVFGGILVSHCSESARDAKTQSAADTAARVAMQKAEDERRRHESCQRDRAALVESYNKLTEHINRTTNAYGTHEQWVYSGSRAYLYFDDGVLTSIQN